MDIDDRQFYKTWFKKLIRFAEEYYQDENVQQLYLDIW